jgi:hypothetical protein
MAEEATKSIKVIDRAGPHAQPGNSLEIRAENCDCAGAAESDKCNYEIVVDAEIEEILVSDKGETASVELPRFPYEISEEGAAALEEDLKAAVGLAADDVSVTFNTDEITIAITATKAVFLYVNGAAFTQTCPPFEVG